MIDIKVYESKKDALNNISDDINKKISEFKKSNTPLLFLISGGSVLEILDYIKKDFLGDFMTISVLDERFDITNKNNNFTQLSERVIYKAMVFAGVNFIDTSVKYGQTKEELADFFEEELKSWNGKKINGRIIAIFGVGIDGHTSGIMPFFKDEKKFLELFEGDRWVISYDASGKNQYSERVTTTNTFLRRIDEAFVFVIGEEKKMALENMQKNGSVAEVPARILAEINAKVYTNILFKNFEITKEKD
ncbi:MAG: 6-phosphogluconolactonase [Patescibacteria group bacterium]